MSITGHVYPAGHHVFWGDEPEETYRHRNALLVQALRSGEFTQATGALEKWNFPEVGKLLPAKQGNCCLGVACYVASHHGVEVTITHNLANGYQAVLFGSGNGDPQSGMPPVTVSNWFGWDAVDPALYDETEVSRYTRRYAASHRNDGLGQDFATIADAFERTFVTFTYEEPSTVDGETTTQTSPE